ncbi:hypothetical protein L249_2877 [Ophiocordyceps polyrhachis-furcata BCC 54312]|uniref:Metallo-beta-lactamase domain-containing protein n=1 Tax=Ophiocordyceps polyrhachis-furcata BCC 54312 TaxID=1330021 RepID=A0A367LQG4_9HYPO|nr:hypothetical protein L249_2877 [Ophiocordyceps polyrhachis-furcata BCC 54312]
MGTGSSLLRPRPAQFAHFAHSKRASGSVLGATAAMSAALIPAKPEDFMVIRNITPNITTFSAPFSRYGKLRIGGRGTLVRLSSGSLAIFSPIALTEATKTKVSDMGGEVGYIVALDFEHHIFVTEWARQYPDAKIIGPEGLEDKRRGQQDDPKIGDEKFDVVFTKNNKRQVRISPEFDADFNYEYVDGHSNLELVFLYKPDRVLIEADLMFNLPPNEQYSKAPQEDRKLAEVVDSLFQTVQSTEGDPKWMRRFNWYMAANDRGSLNKSIKLIDKWDFTTVIPCHGDVLEGDGKDVFRKVFKWHLEAKD